MTNAAMNLSDPINGTTLGGAALALAGAGVLKLKLKPLRRLALVAIPFGFLLALVGDLKQTCVLAAAWCLGAWLYNR